MSENDDPPLLVQYGRSMTDYAAEWLEWQGRLDSSPIPPRVAVWVARHGAVSDRHALAMDHRLPLDAVLILAEDDDQMVIDFLTSNLSVPSDVLMSLVTSGKVSIDAVRSHWHAPAAYMLTAPLFSLATRTISLFLEAVQADDDECARMWKAHESPTRRKRTLGDLWSTIRSV
jgi:hypothetical protein